MSEKHGRHEQEAPPSPKSCRPRCCWPRTTSRSSTPWSSGWTREGFDVTVARDGNEALRLFAAVEPDLVLLDLMLPRLSGIDVCRSIRARSSVPIIMVTAKGTEIDTVVGLEVGADDYVTKPYRLRELVARMRAVLRRTPPTTRTIGPGRADPSATAGERARHRGDGTATGDGPPPSVLEAGGIQIDPDRHLVFVRGEDVHLRRKEFELLSLLMENAGRLLTRDVLIDRIWGSDYFGDTKTLDVHIKRLRSHVEEDPSSPKLITTIRGVGYRFDAPARDLIAPHAGAATGRLRVDPRPTPAGVARDDHLRPGGRGPAPRAGPPSRRPAGRSPPGPPRSGPRPGPSR